MQSKDDLGKKGAKLVSQTNQSNKIKIDENVPASISAAYKIVLSLRSSPTDEPEDTLLLSLSPAMSEYEVVKKLLEVVIVQLEA